MSGVAPTNSVNGQSGSPSAVLAELVDQVTGQLQAGQAIDWDGLLRAHPEHAEELRRLRPALGVLDELSRSGSGGLAVSAAAGGEGEGVGGTLGDFRLIREIGRGGMGVVYEAEQVSLGRRVALKVLPFAATMDSRQLQRFHNEARAAAGLHHTNIVPVYGVGSERGVHYYAMQFIDGRTLADVIAQQQGALPSQVSTTDQAEPRAAAESAPTVPPAAQATSTAPRDAAYFRRAAEWGIQAAEALDCAHALGVVHRDVKPANLLVDAAGRLWVTDFGLAQVQSDTRLTMTGDLVGTLRYMSPEQALAKRVVIDQRTDVYSLGATLYELLTLRPAFTGNDRQELLRQVAFEEPTPPRKLDRGIPAELESIVLKAMEKGPEERYATAQEMADDLRRFLEHKPIQARRATLAQRAGKWAKRHQAVVLTAAVVSSVAAAGLAASTALVWQAKLREGEARAEASTNYERAEAARRKAADAAEREAVERRRANGNFRRAVEEIAELLRRANDPKLVGPPQVEQLRQAQAKEAMKFLQGVLAENRADPEGRLLTGLAYLALGDAHRTRREARAADAYAQALATLEQLRAEARFHRQWDRAKEDVRRAAVFSQMEGDQLRDGGKHAEAARAYGTAIAIAEKCGASLALDTGTTQACQVHAGLFRARLLRASGQVREVEEGCAAALTVLARLMKDHRAELWVPLCVSQQAELLNLRGLSRADAGKAAQAESDFREALAVVGGLTPKDRQLVTHYGMMDPGLPHYALGEVLWARGRQEEARREFRQAEQQWRGLPNSHVRDTRLAWLLAACPDPQMRTPAEATRLARQATGLSKHRVGIHPWQALGVACYRASDWKAAVAALERSRQSNPPRRRH
jgi:serine/threonine protein kinase